MIFCFYVTQTKEIAFAKQEIIMKILASTTILILMSVCTDSSLAQYSGYTTRIGDSTYYSDNKGTRGHSTQIGDSTYYSDNKGTRGRTTRIGDSTYYSGNAALGRSRTSFLNNKIDDNSDYSSKRNTGFRSSFDEERDDSFLNSSYKSRLSSRDSDDDFGKYSSKDYRRRHR